jgi:hypothetical protein
MQENTADSTPGFPQFSEAMSIIDDLVWAVSAALEEYDIEGMGCALSLAQRLLPQVGRVVDDMHVATGGMRSGTYDAPIPAR